MHSASLTLIPSPVGVLWARLQNLLFYNQSNLKNRFFFFYLHSVLNQKRFKSTTYILDAPIGNKGIKEKSSLSPHWLHVITLDNVPKKLPGWQAIFWKTRHHICLYEHERMCFMYSCFTKQHRVICFMGDGIPNRWIRDIALVLICT